MANKRDYYEVLGVSRDADTAALKKAYRRTAMKHHPDRNPGDKAAEAKFKEASEAFEILSDQQKRSRYDQFGHAGVAGQAGGAGRDMEVGAQGGPAAGQPAEGRAQRFECGKDPGAQPPAAPTMATRSTSRLE